MTLDLGRDLTPDPGPGSVLPGGYRIDERIGSGGMGVVYRATHVASGTVVAVKVLRHGATDQRFVEEGRVLARLDHPGLVGIVDEGDLDGQPFLVLDFVSGPTLRQLLELGPMEADEVARIGAELARTLAYVHAQDVVHRDVKPSNVLVAPDGRPVLNDFGVSYRHGRTRWTESGFVNGTAAYLAPEQVLGEPPAPPIDVYALGLVLLECLSGIPEYDGTAIECAVARLHRAPRRPVAAPAWLADVLADMTATDPTQRPTATEAAARLAGEPKPKPKPVPMAVPVPAPRRERARMSLLAGATAVAAAGLAAVVLLPGSSPIHTSGEPLPGQPPPGTIATAAPTTHAPPPTGTARTPDRPARDPGAVRVNDEQTTSAAPDPVETKTNKGKSAKGHGSGNGTPGVPGGGPGKGQRSA